MNHQERKLMKSKTFIAVLGVAAAGVALPAVAQMRSPSLSSAYVGGSVGQGEQKFDCGSSDCDRKDTAWRLFGGYRFHPNFSAELGYADLGTAKFGGTDVETKAWDLSALGAFPLGNQFSLFGRLGGYHATTDAGSLSEDKNGLTYGLGAQYDLNRNLGLRAEWQRYHKVGGGDLGQEANADMLSVGALWHFQ
jgi:OOP family OmpA-OmpF porin